MLPIDLSIDQHANQAAEKQMLTGEHVFINQLQHNAQTLKQGAMLLASDESFKDVLARSDDQALQSSLVSHQQRNHVDVVFYYNIISQKMTSSLPLNMAEQQVIQAFITHQKTGQLQFVHLQKVPYQLEVVPVEAPVMTGWIILGYKVDQGLANQLKTLSNLDISFFQKNKTNQWQTIVSTLRPNISNKLLNVIAKTHAQKLSLKTLSFHEGVYQLKTRTLIQDSENTLIAVLQSSVSENIAPFNHLKWIALGLTVIGFTIFAVLLMYVTKVMTLPMNELLDNVKEMAKGDYRKKIKNIGNNDLGQLGQAINEMREAVSVREQKVHDLAFSDELTGLANRLGLMQALNQAIEQHAKTESSLSVVVVNIDRFKQINTTFGRDFGDEVLRNVGKTLKSFLFSKDDFVARLDADQFVVVLQNTEQEKATTYASEINALFKTPMRVSDQLIDLRVSMGISLYPSHGDSEENLLHRAETAQQAAKQKKSAWIVYNRALEIDHSDKLLMVTELKEAIKNNQLVIYLQPKVNIKTKEVVGAEALIRWIHPTKGILFPEQFMPYVEQTATISQVTNWMVEETCKIMVGFKKQLIPTNISVNLSSRDLNNLDLPNQIQKCLQAHGLNPKVLRLEITENALMEEPKRTASVVNKLAELGIHISIDDFGSGYSSLAYLRELPLNELKIDKSFVKQMDTSSSDRAIVRSSIDLARNLGLKVVAEGIDSEETIKQLANMGCDIGQGYYICKPMPVRDFGVWLERWNNQLNQIEYDLELRGSPLDIVATSYKPSLEMALSRALETTEA